MKSNRGYFPIGGEVNGVSITITLQEAEIYDFGIERVDDGRTVYFSVEGAVQNVDEELLKEALEAQDLHPEKIILGTGEASSGGDSGEV